MDLRRAAVLVALLAAACGSGSKTAPALNVPITGLETKAGMTACTTSPEPLTLAVATCTYGSGSVTLGTFATNTNRDLWVLAAKTSAGGMPVEGDGWAVVTLDQDDAATLATALGGKIS